MDRLPSLHGRRLAPLPRIAGGFRSEKQNGSEQENTDGHDAGTRGLQQAERRHAAVPLLDHRPDRDFYQVGKLLTRSGPSDRYMRFSA